MTDTAPRPTSTRGRGSGRGGRGSSRGGFRHRDRNTNGDDTKDSTAFDDIADQGELGEMKKQYSSQLSTLKELFSDWTDVDLLFALQETDGDLDRTIEHITEGMHNSRELVLIN
jgi:CUE domain